MTRKSTSKPSKSTNGRFAALAETSRKLAEARSPPEIASAANALLAALGDPAALAQDLERAAREAEAASRQGLLSLETDLRAACTRNGWSFNGVWPTFFIEKAIEVAIDEPARSVRVAGKRLDMAADVIVDTAAPLVRQLLPRAFAPDAFLQSIANAIDVVAAPDAGAPIWQVYRQLVIDAQTSRFWRDAKAESFVPMSLEQFRARLSKSLEAESGLQDGRLLRLSPPLNPSDGIFLWQAAERRFGYVGRLQLVRESRQ